MTYSEEFEQIVNALRAAQLTDIAIEVERDLLASTRELAEVGPETNADAVYPIEVSSKEKLLVLVHAVRRALVDVAEMKDAIAKNLELPAVSLSFASEAPDLLPRTELPTAEDARGSLTRLGEAIASRELELKNVVSDR